MRRTAILLIFCGSFFVGALEAQAVEWLSYKDGKARQAANKQPMLVIVYDGKKVKPDAPLAAPSASTSPTLTLSNTGGANVIALPADPTPKASKKPAGKSSAQPIIPSNSKPAAKPASSGDTTTGELKDLMGMGQKFDVTVSGDKATGGGGPPAEKAKTTKETTKGKKEPKPKKPKEKPVDAKKEIKKEIQTMRVGDTRETDDFGKNENMCQAIFSSPEVALELEGVIAVKVDFNTEKDAVAELKVTQAPTYLFYLPEGLRLDPLEGESFRPPDIIKYLHTIKGVMDEDPAGGGGNGGGNQGPATIGI